MGQQKTLAPNQYFWITFLQCHSLNYFRCGPDYQQALANMSVHFQLLVSHPWYCCGFACHIHSVQIRISTWEHCSSCWLQVWSGNWWGSTLLDVLFLFSWIYFYFTVFILCYWVCGRLYLRWVHQGLVRILSQSKRLAYYHCISNSLYVAKGSGNIGKRYLDILKSAIVDSPSTPTLITLLLVYKLGEMGAMNMLPLMLLDSGMPIVKVGFWTGVIGQIISIIGSSSVSMIVQRFGWVIYICIILNNI